MRVMVIDQVPYASNDRPSRMRVKVIYQVPYASNGIDQVPGVSNGNRPSPVRVNMF